MKKSEKGGSNFNVARALKIKDMDAEVLMSTENPALTALVLAAIREVLVKIADILDIDSNNISVHPVYDNNTRLTISLGVRAKTRLSDIIAAFTHNNKNERCQSE